MTKVLIVSSEFPPQPGGIGNHAFNLAKGLQENGYDVKLVCDRRSKNGNEEFLFDADLDFQVVRINREQFILKSYIKRIKVAFSLAKNSEIIICSGKFSLWLGAFLSLLQTKKNIAIIHGSEVLLSNYFLRKLTDFSLKRFKVIIAVSNYTKSLISKLSTEKVVVIPNGFNVEVEIKKPVKNKPLPILITVGNLTQRKGQHNIINALPTLLKKYPDLKYYIVGIPTEKPRLEKLALHLKVESAVVFFGKVSEQEKIALLQQSDVFVMLSETTNRGDVEGFGIAILEANAVGVPAIGALHCGIEDAINDGVSGKLINLNTPIELLESLDEILGNYEMYSKAAEVWSRNFTWEKILDKYLEVLRKI